MTSKYRYPALLSSQGSGAKPVVLFSAPAVEIEAWAGIPQKKQFGSSDESLGFQREQNSKRIASLKKFFQDPQNVIQNPLLCSTRVNDPQQINFVASKNGVFGNSQFGHIEIQVEKFEELSFQTILQRVKGYLEQRVPELLGKSPSKRLVLALTERARLAGHINESTTNTRDIAEAIDETLPDSENSEVGAVLFEESHIYDFWEEIAARLDIASKIPDPIMGEDFIGFSREALSSYLCPVVLVDGQHRLRGAIAAAYDRLQSEDLQFKIEERISSGDLPDVVESELLLQESRHLTISLLLTDDPAEQVFQFVVVNQKATPIGRALLGTIVSTTLSNDELGRVATRLKNAAIELEESQAITYLARHSDSPFCGLVERGMATDQKDALQWNVFASIINIFKDLSGGRLFHQKNDYADVWRKKFLDSSPISDNYEDAGCKTRMEYWSKLDGPWRSVFIQFFTKIRDKFGNTTDPDKPNFWGKSRQSNLFNKISLTILAADFFEYLVTRKQTISSAHEISGFVDDWLEGVNSSYFDKDWQLSGIKKDNPGIRKQWASLWAEYRKDPSQLPDRRKYRSALLD
ncbi:hypothetical protein [Janthinobacterium sp.]|uniref:hypothetical protein n=1 Tax=Janthinobacterium sp. TaxID=1871054 RepID=UPI002625E048|nr:hypothetical protein [Janthinobacterium sp.]